MIEDSNDNAPPENPRYVERGSNLHLGFIGIDSLYVVLQYPHDDVYDRWVSHVPDLLDPRLFAGIVTPDEYVIRRGSNGYNLSVWDGDARLFMTDHVTDRLIGTPYEGQGMGLMLQLGPKWLIRHANIMDCKKFIDNVFAQFIIFGVISPDSYPARINRLDITVDVIGFDTNTISLDEWGDNWVGYANPTTGHFRRKQRGKEGLHVGSGHGAVQFRLYDKVTESMKRGSNTFWRSVWGLEENENPPVTRFEWTVRCHRANFVGLRYIPDLTTEKLFELANYLVFKWGRICIPNPNDSNDSRWATAPIWEAVQAFIQSWHQYHEGVAQRKYDLNTDISDAYLRSFVGWVTGLQARLGIHSNMDEPVHLSTLLRFLEANEYTTEKLYELAAEKRDRLAILSGKE